jgi:hypothetical protein
MKRTAILLGILAQTHLMSIDSFDYIFDKIEDYGCNAEASADNQQQQMYLKKFQNAQVDQETINYYYEQRKIIDLDPIKSAYKPNYAKLSIIRKESQVEDKKIDKKLIIKNKKAKKTLIQKSKEDNSSKEIKDE